MAGDNARGNGARAGSAAKSSAGASPSDVTPVSAHVVRALEAVLLVAVEPVSVTLLAQLLEQPTDVVEGVCQRLAEAYAEAGHGFQLVEVAGGWRYQTHPDVAAYVERFLLDGQQARVSSAALETLAIIAYKQPISRQQVAAIRGVDPEAVMRTLQARGYITEVSRDEGPGQAVLFGTTSLFLEKLGINSLDDLPSISDFVPDARVVEALEQGLRVTPTEAAAPRDNGAAASGT
jgi:segregation and condensation protein B